MEIRRIRSETAQGPRESLTRERIRRRSSDSSQDRAGKAGRRGRVLDTGEEDISQGRADSATGQDQDPTEYWSHHYRWPPKHFEVCDNMATSLVPQKRSMTPTSRRSSEAGSVKVASVTPSDQKPREWKSTEYRHANYELLLRTKGSFMEDSELGITDPSKQMCLRLLEDEVDVPTQSLFRDDIFERTCRMIHARNEAKVVQDIARLIVPSAETLATFGAEHLNGLIESVNQGWGNSISITKTRPQPDYAVGFRHEAFMESRLKRLEALVGDVISPKPSYFMATDLMFFPFLTSEVKCGDAALNVADRQNAHSMTVAVRAVVELFRKVRREKELHREILAFSISHDDDSVRLYGHYAVTVEPLPKYYRHTIRKFAFTEVDGKEKWTAYKFTRNIYDVWMPKHLERICSAIDQIPDVSFATSASELPSVDTDPSEYRHRTDTDKAYNTPSTSANRGEDPGAVKGVPEL